MEKFDAFRKLLKCSKVDIHENDDILAITNDDLNNLFEMFSMTIDTLCNFPNLQKIISNHVIDFFDKNMVTMLSGEKFDYVENQSVDGIQLYETFLIEKYNFITFEGILLSQNDYDSLEQYSKNITKKPAPTYHCTKKYDGRSGEDRIVKKIFQSNGDSILFMAVFDGHGGKRENSEIANYISANADRFEILANPFPKNSEMLEKKAATLFAKLDKEMEDKNLQHGSTGTICIHNETNGDTFFAHVGDSRAICRDDNDQLYETKDHKPGDPEEIERVELAGGFVLMGRVPRVGGSLAVSRSFGDFRFKRKQTNTIGDWISVVPKITSNNGNPIKISKKDSFILLASDGLWDGFTSKEVKIFIDLNLSGENVCEALVQKGKKKTSDDIAILLHYYK